MHSLLARQLRKSGYVPGGPADAILAMVDAAYAQYDDDRRMLERSLELSSRELLGANSDLRALLGALPDLFVRLDADGVVTDVQGPPPAEYFPGATVLRGRSFQELLAPADREAITSTLARVRTGGVPASFEYTLSDEEGGVRHYEARFLRVLEEQVIALIRNITAIKAEEQAKEARTARMEQQQAALHQLAAAEGTDPAGAFARACQITARTLGAGRVSIWHFVEGRTAIDAAWLFADGAAASPVGLRLERRDYPRYFAAIEAAPSLVAADALHDPRTSEFADGYLRPHGIGAMLDCAIRVGGEVVGVFCVEHLGGPREWTLEERDFVAAVTSFVALSYTLEHQRALEAQLRHSQKMEAVGMLAGGIAHDFNNLLTAILGFAELLRASKRLDPLAHSHVSEIVLAGQRASELTSQLLAFGRKQPRTPRLVPLNTLVADASRLLGRVVGEAITFDVRPSPKDVIVRVDPNQIEQVLMNLVVNARDAMAESGGTLRIAVAEVAAGIESKGVPATLAPGPWAVLEVSDTGVGIPAGHLTRVFEPFFTTKAVGEGTGLGLSMVYGLVQQNGGQVDLTSVEGKGTTVRVFLPIEATAAHGDGALLVGPDGALSGGRETILLVEDEAVVRMLAVELLQRLGYQVLVAARPSEALALLEVEGPRVDLLVTDLVMPEMNGAELYRAASRLRPGLRVLFMSGYAPDKILRATMLRPGTLFLAKPFTLKQLSEKVRSAIESGVPVGAG